MGAPIEKLPVELVDLILSHLPLSFDYQNIRLASRQLHALTLSTFSNRYFSKRTTTLGFPSLDRLLRVSTCSHLAESVSMLDVKLLSHDEYQTLQKIRRVGIYPPPKRFPKIPRVRTEDISRESELFEYIQTHDDPKFVIDALSRALRGFPNLRTIRVRANGVNLSGRIIASLVSTQEEDVYDYFAMTCFRALLSAITKSGTRLHKFLTTKGAAVNKSTNSINLIYPAFDFSMAYLLSLGSVFASLKCLTLSMSVAYHDDARVPGWQNGISQLICSAPALEELTICMGPPLMGSKYKAAVACSLFRSVELPQLRIFRLHGCVVDEEDFSLFARMHSHTLRHLAIGDTFLREGDWLSILTLLRDSLSLEYLRLSKLRQPSFPRHVVWRRGAKFKKTITMDLTRDEEPRSMREWLSEAIHIQFDQNIALV